MFSKTYTARKPPKSPPGRDQMVLSAAAACCLQGAHTIRTTASGVDRLSTFLSLVTLTSDL